MLASLFSFALLALLASPAAAQTTTWGFCFTSSSLPNSPYGPWSVAMGGTLTVSVPFYFDVSGTGAAAGGQRWAQNVTAASVTRTQLNRDGTTSIASLGLATKGVQGSDMVFFNSTPYTDWNGMAFAVQSSTDKPFAGSNNWIVFPNDFPVQAVELYYDLPTYTYPTEYHHDNQTNAVMVIQPNTMPSCTPAPITTTLQCAALTYQFCYQAYGAAQGSNAAWQTAIQGTFLTKTSTAASTISGTNGLYILSATGTRSQSVGGAAATTVPIVGQTWHNSGGGDANEFGDDPLLMGSSPFLVPGKGFVLYTGSQFSYPNGTMETIDNGYALVNSDPLIVGGSGAVIEQQGPKPDWSALAISCSCSAMSCPLISSSSNAATGDSSASGSCSAQSLSQSGGSCTTSSSIVASSGTCSASGPGKNAAVQVTLSATVLVAVVAALAMLL